MKAAESKLSISDTGTKTIEGGIRALISANRPLNADEAAAEPCGDILAAGAASIADIENLMGELLVARDYLQAEGERVRRLTTRYAHLTQTASASVKIIADSIGKWRNPDLGIEKLGEAHTAMIEAPAPKLVPDDKVQATPEDPLSRI